MNKQQAKKILQNFIGDQTLTFSIKTFKNSTEWVAKCDQIPAIITGGTGNDYSTMYNLMLDAVLTAAGVDGKFSNCIYNASIPKGTIKKTQDSYTPINFPKTQMVVS